MGRKKVGVGRSVVDKTAAAHIKTGIVLCVIQVGEEAHEARKVEHVDDVEIGKVALTGIQPPYAVLHESIETVVALL